MHELLAATKVRGQGPFDVVVFAGVLYHMIDPLAGMAIARSFLREGGIAVLETSVFCLGRFRRPVQRLRALL